MTATDRRRLPVLALALALAGCAAAQAPAAPPAPRAPDAEVQALERRAAELANAYRVRLGLRPLAYDPRIAEIARGHSAGMAAGRVPFGHGGFDARVAELRALLPLTGVAENVAFRGPPEPALADSVFQGWVDSPGHRENLEGPYDRTGIGVALAPRGVAYFTQIFVRTGG